MGKGANGTFPNCTVMPTARCFAPGNNHYNNLVIGGKVTEAGNCILQHLEGIGVELCDKRGIMSVALKTKEKGMK